MRYQRGFAVQFCIFLRIRGILEIGLAVSGRRFVALRRASTLWRSRSSERHGVEQRCGRDAAHNLPQEKSYDGSD